MLESNAAARSVITCPPLVLDMFFSNEIPSMEERTSVLPAATFEAVEANELAGCVPL